MMKRLRMWVTDAGARSSMPTPTASEPPASIDSTGLDTLPLTDIVRLEDEFPDLDWDGIARWVATGADETTRSAAWSAAERAWLEHLRVALGAGYRVDESSTAMLLSSLAPNVARATLDYMGKTLQRIVRVLDGIAEVAPWGKDVLIVFDDPEVYYRYVSRFSAEGGEFGLSSGMFIRGGCAHFVTVKDDLRLVEPVIAHEMTHACVSHLPIPAWVNEGLAVNTEKRLSPQPPPPVTPAQMHLKHRAFWDEASIQEFWAGSSFLRMDDGQLLSYDLASILVAQFADDWAAFRDFVRDATLDDAGASSAARHLRIDLGRAVASLLDGPPAADWSPAPARWPRPPESGAF